MQNRSMNQTNKALTTPEDNPKATLKRERWAAKTVETDQGRLGRSMEGGGTAKRNKASKNSRRGRQNQVKLTRAGGII
jgi:hypothetical protein